MLKFYYSLGEEIISLKAESRWGSGFYKKLNSDLKNEILNVKGFSVTNLKYMKNFYEMYSPLNRPQLVDDLRISKVDEYFNMFFSISVVGNSEEFIDMLLYNIKLHCYVVVEVKIYSFKPADIGQLGTYVTSVHHILKGDGDNQTIGLLICKTKDNILAKYASESSREPIGISEYQLQNLILESLKGALPTIEEIENELK